MCRVTTFPYPIIACPLQKICRRYSTQLSQGGAGGSARLDRPRPNIRLGDYGAAKDDLPIDERLRSI
ncbi:hypothetical protein PVAP13_5KG301521 [Panicum virgatum]|uniref:Uncharacterized protein n=1 Tax=Panicum virgatum TaxID=38727 RepID=A0A8T0SJ04_PANVG|nr:hypothetical protein PVAP13_5KG301521 [Panicum virgatum]